MARLRRKLTYANVMATIAVFIALGGASYAAIKLPKNSVGTKQLKKEAVTAAKIKDGAVTPGKLDAAAKTSLTGAQGPQGPKGDPGSAKAWAEVSSGGRVLRSSGGITVEKIDLGFYCVDGGSFTTANSVAVGTLNYSDGSTGLDGQIVIANTSASNICKAGQFEVLIGRDSGEPAGMGFIFVIP